MRTIFRVYAITLLLVTGIGAKSFAQDKDTQVLTLRQCFDYAFQNSRDFRKALLDIQESEAAHKENKAALLPQISGSASLKDNIKLSTMLMPGDMFGYDGDIAVEMGAKYNSYAGADLEQVVFDANLFTGIKISRNAKELARLAAQMTKEELIYNIGIAYYDIIYSQNLLKTNRLTLAIMDSIYAKTELQVAQKVTREIDLNRMKVNISNLKVDVRKATATITQQKNYLKVLIGMPISCDFNVTEQVETPISGSVCWESPGINDKTELRILDREKTAAMLEIRRFKGAYLPTLTLGVSSGYNFESPKFALDYSQFWSNGTYLQFTLSVPVFDGGQRRHKIRQAQFRLQKIQEDIKQTTQNILSDMDNYRSQLMIGYDAIQAQRENMEIAERTWQQGIMLYEEGLYSITDLLDTEKSYREAQTAYTYELVNYQKTLLDLMNVEGTLELFVSNKNKHKNENKENCKYPDCRSDNRISRMEADFQQKGNGRGVRTLVNRESHCAGARGVGKEAGDYRRYPCRWTCTGSPRSNAVFESAGNSIG
jgi:outer membrane protein TolC